MPNKERTIEPYQDYFWDFYNHLKPEVKEKVDHVLQIAISLKRIPSNFYKHLEDGLYEIEKAKRLRKNYYETRKNKGRQ